MTAGGVTPRRQSASVASNAHEQPEKQHAQSAEEKAAAAAPDGGWGWVVVVSSFVIHIIVDGITYAFGVLFKALLADFHSGKGETAWILSIFVGLTLGAGPLASALVNKYNCRVVTIAGGFIGAVGFLISPFAPGLWFLYISLGLVAGIGFGLIYMPAVVIVGYYFERRRALAIGIAVAGSGVGTFIFAPFIEYLVEEYGWKQSCILLSGIILNCVLFGALFRPLPIEMRKSSPAKKGSKQAKANRANCKKQQMPKGACQLKTDPSDLRTTATTVSGMMVTEDAANDEFGKYPHSRELLLANSTKSFGEDQDRDKKLGHAEPHVHIPLRKKDVLYGGSLKNIPLYVSNHDLYLASNVSTPSLAPSEKLPCCACCSADMATTFRGMLDVSLLKDGAFVLFLISNFFTNFGFNAPFLYVPDRASEEGGLSDTDAAFLLSILGIANTAGRVIFGFLGDIPSIKAYRLHIYNTGLVIAGVATALSAVTQVYWTSVVYCCTFGIFIGCYVSLTSVILVDLLGLDRLTSSFGMTLLVQGIAVVIGPPACGQLRDATASYMWPFLVLGLSIGISGAMLYFIPCLPRSSCTAAGLALGRDEKHDEEMGKVIGIHDHHHHRRDESAAAPAMCLDVTQPTA